MEINAPIPGESLTTTPKNAIYERPPEISDPEDALMMYLDKLSNKETMESIIDSLEMGVDLKTLVEGMTRIGVSKGIHSIDVSLIVAPVLHEHIKSFADDLKVDYDEGIEDKDKESKRQKVLYAKASRKVAGRNPEPVDKPKEKEEIKTKPVKVEDKPKGLMARR